MKIAMIKLTRLACCALAFGFVSVTSSYAGPGPQQMPHITTQEQVSALSPGSKVVMTCGKCKTVQIAEVDRKHGILGWFQPKTKHLCPGCGGYIQPTVQSVKGIGAARYVHTCSKCGSSDTFCCGGTGGKM